MARWFDAGGVCMNTYEEHNQQLKKLMHLISTTPQPDNEEAWFLEFCILIAEITAHSPTIKHRINRISSNFYKEAAFSFENISFEVDHKSEKMLTALLQDEIFYYAPKTLQDEVFMRKRKLLEARRESIDFEDDLAAIICGDNTKFPYRSSYYITKFFQDCGYDYTHDGTTRVKWVSSVIQELNVHDIYQLTEAVFKRKYFLDFAHNKKLELEKLITDAQMEFANFLDNSISANRVIDLSPAYKLNINLELLSNKIAETDDKILNQLINSAKSFYIEGKKQEAIEKIWDAFERIKSVLSPSNKKKSTNDLINFLSIEIEKTFFDDEFKALTYIGNNYMIRHSEIDKIPLTDIPSKEYLFFRMLALLDLSIQKIPKN